jgi:vitamin B12 transporter
MVIHLLSRVKKMKKKFVSVIYLFFIASSMYAQNDSTTDTAEVRSLSEIIIQQSRLQIPFSKQNRNITILDQEVIKALPVKSVNEILTYVAGVDLRQRAPWGVQADVSIDGGTFDQTLVLLNGIKITDPQTGHNMMQIPVNVDAIERIEILKGPAARIYGINALNGAINIITKKPQKNTILIHSFAGSSFKKDSSNGKLFGGYGMEVTANLSGKKISHLISVSHNQSSGYRYNTSFQNEKVLYENTIRLGENKTINFLGGFNYNDFGANSFYAAPKDAESKEKVQVAIAGISASLPINSVWTLRPRISYRYSHDDYIFIRQNPDFYHNKHATNVLDAELNNIFYTGIGNFGVGAEAAAESINSNSLGKHDRINYGFFAEYSFNKIENFLLNVGAYTNYNSDFGWQFLPGVDVGYTVKKNVRVFANAGTGQRLPTYTDLYYKGPVNIGNEQLKPEHSVQTEAGIKYNGTLLNASASYFHRNTTDFIDWVKDSINQPWQPQNFSEIKTHGISFMADYRLFDPKQSFFTMLVGLSYTWLHLQIAPSAKSDKISQYALENLRNQLAARLDMRYKNQYEFALTGKYQQRINSKSYTVLDARIAFSAKRYKIYTDFNNITNVTYIEAGAVPMVGRWMTLGVKWRVF